MARRQAITVPARVLVTVDSTVPVLALATVTSMGLARDKYLNTAITSIRTTTNTINLVIVFRFNMLEK